MDYQRFHDGAELARLYHRICRSNPITEAVLWPAIAPYLDPDDPTMMLPPVDSDAPGCVPPLGTPAPQGSVPDRTRAIGRGRHRGPRRKMFGGWTAWRA